MRNYQTRLARLRELKPPPEEEEPLTDEERAEAIQALLVRAEAEPDNEELQRRAAFVRGIIEHYRQRYARVAAAVGMDAGADPDEIEALGVALIIESHSNPDDLGLAQRRRAAQMAFDEMGFRYWNIPAWETFKASPAGVEYDARRAADLAGRLGRAVTTPPVEDVGATETPTGASQPGADSPDKRGTSLRPGGQRSGIGPAAPDASGDDVAEAAGRRGGRELVRGASQGRAWG